MRTITFNFPRVGKYFSLHAGSLSLAPAPGNDCKYLKYFTWCCIPDRKTEIIRPGQIWGVKTKQLVLNQIPLTTSDLCFQHSFTPLHATASCQASRTKPCWVSWSANVGPDLLNFDWKQVFDANNHCRILTSNSSSHPARFIKIFSIFLVKIVFPWTKEWL